MQKYTYTRINVNMDKVVNVVNTKTKEPFQIKEDYETWQLNARQSQIGRSKTTFTLSFSLSPFKYQYLPAEKK